jgi:Tfp pilus assembly protein FimT
MSPKVNKAYSAYLPIAGFSLVEMCLVAALACIVGGFAVLNINAMMPGLRTNEAMYLTMAQLRSARETAIAQRRNVEIRFLDNNRIQVVRHELPAGETILNDVNLSYRCEFRLFDGIPDSPDTFGNAAAVDFGSANILLFLSDGTLVDEQNNPLSGSVFIGLPDKPETARVITILGATGRVRSYRWDGSSWIQ